MSKVGAREDLLQIVIDTFGDCRSSWETQLQAAERQSAQDGLPFPESFAKIVRLLAEEAPLDAPTHKG